jgi:sugar/nucleoside kinase (ribokinase family)
LYGYLSGFDVAHMGRAGARVASAVIAQHGAGLSPAAAAKLTAAMPQPATSGLPAVADCLNSASEQ